ncbi:hypothetical protein Hanom_Chr06g00536811 [Helianthus anomalus]
MVGVKMQEKNQRQLEVNEFHNQAGYLTNPPVEHMELFGSLIQGLNNCPITRFMSRTRYMQRLHKHFQEHSKDQKTRNWINRSNRSKDEDYCDRGNSARSLKIGRAATPSNCITENKGGFDQLNKTQTFAIIALVNGWDFNLSTFIFDNMKKMLEDPKKKIFMLYPRFIQMILDDRYPTLVKGLNFINLKPMGPSCFENACRNKRAKNPNFEGIPPVVPVAPVPPPINAQIAEEHDVQFMQQAQQVADDDDEIQVVDSESETGSSEETDSESEVEIVMSDKEEDTVRKHGGDGNPSSVSTTDVQKDAATSQVETRIEASTDDAEELSKKKQRTDFAPDDIISGPSTAPESTPIIDPQPDPKQKMHRRRQAQRTQFCMTLTLILKPPPHSQAIQVVVFNSKLEA